jgi:hypothetical protein
MKPVNFKEATGKIRNNIDFEGYEPEYLYVCQRGTVGTTCWKVSFMERLKILFTGKLYVKLHLSKLNNSLPVHFPFVKSRDTKSK